MCVNYSSRKLEEEKVIMTYSNNNKKLPKESLIVITRIYFSPTKNEGRFPYLVHDRLESCELKEYAFI